LDVSNRKQITEVMQKAKECFGGVDILINNAGIVQGKYFHEMNEAMATKTMIVNAESHIWTVREVLPDMMKRNNGKGKGHIVGVSSLAGLGGCIKMSDYCASKAAAYIFMESLRNEMKAYDKDITCTTICPYWVDTGMFEGVKCYSWYPLLKPDYVVNRIVNAVLQNENCQVVIPIDIGFWTHFFKAIYPSYIRDWTFWYFV